MSAKSVAAPFWLVAATALCCVGAISACGSSDTNPGFQGGDNRAAAAMAPRGTTQAAMAPAATGPGPTGRAETGRAPDPAAMGQEATGRARPTARARDRAPGRAEPPVAPATPARVAGPVVGCQARRVARAAGQARARVVPAAAAAAAPLPRAQPPRQGRLCCSKVATSRRPRFPSAWAGIRFRSPTGCPWEARRASARHPFAGWVPPELQIRQRTVFTVAASG